MTFMHFSLDKNKVQFKSRPAIGFDNLNKKILMCWHLQVDLKNIKFYNKTAFKIGTLIKTVVLY